MAGDGERLTPQGAVVGVAIRVDGDPHGPRVQVAPCRIAWAVPLGACERAEGDCDDLLRPRDGARPIAAGMGIATRPTMSAHHLTVDVADETLDRRHAVDLLVLDQVRTKGWERLLFVECGDGWLAEEAWRRMGKGWVCGLSTSEQLVDRAARLRGVPGRVEFKTWGGDRFPLPDRSFDRVILCVPWSAFLDPRAVLREVARTLRPEGDAYLLESDGSTPTTSQDLQAADLGPLLADAGLGAVRWNSGATAPSEQRDRMAPGVVHVRLRAPGA